MELKTYDHPAHLKNEITRLERLKENTPNPADITRIESNLELLKIDLHSLTQQDPSNPEVLDFSGVNMDHTTQNLANPQEQPKVHHKKPQQACPETQEALTEKTLKMHTLKQDGRK